MEIPAEWIYSILFIRYSLQRRKYFGKIRQDLISLFGLRRDLDIFFVYFLSFFLYDVLGMKKGVRVYVCIFCIT